MKNRLVVVSNRLPIAINQAGDNWQIKPGEGGLVTAMLPSGGQNDPAFRIVIVGKANSDPYPEHDAAIHALGVHFGLSLDRARCYPYCP